MDRRGFLGSILALGAAPAIVRAGSLMPLWVPTTEESVITLYPGNRILTIDQITAECLRILQANLTLKEAVMVPYDIGGVASSIKVRAPGHFSITTRTVRIQ